MRSIHLTVALALLLLQNTAISPGNYTCSTSAQNNNVGQLICSSGTVAAITGNSAAQNIFSCSIPAALFNTGHVFDIDVWWTHSTGSASVAYLATLGATNCNASWSDATAGTGYHHHIFIAVTATNQEYCSVDPVIKAPSGASAFISSSGAVSTSATETTGASSQLVVTFNVANTDQVTPKMLIGRAF